MWDFYSWILCHPEPWFEFDTGRLEFVSRVRLWRHLTGDPDFDAHYWLSRLENDPSAPGRARADERGLAP
jgi:hypothetical protein